MRILLVQLPPWGLQMPPIGLAYIAGALKHHDVTILDMNALMHKRSPSLKHIWDSRDTGFWEKDMENYYPFFAGLIRDAESYDIVGFSANSLSYGLIRHLCQKISKPKKIVGGMLAGEKRFRESIDADIFFAGESEEVISQVLEGDLSVVDVHDEGDHKLVTPKHKPRLSLIPDYSKFDSSLYGDVKTLPISFSRGCIRRCAFCSDTHQSFPFRHRKAMDVVDEMRQVVHKFGRRIFSVTDLIINGSISFLDSFADELIRSRMRVLWSGQATIREEMDPALLSKLRLSGLHDISYGLESMSDRTLQRMQKGYGPDTAAKVIKDTKDAGISIGANIIVGFPGESEEDHAASMEGIESLLPYIDRINNLNMCTINDGAMLCTDPKGFQIKELRHGSGFVDSNGLDERGRIERLKQAYHHFRSKGLEPAWCNGREMFDKALIADNMPPLQIGPSGIRTKFKN